MYLQIDKAKVEKQVWTVRLMEVENLVLTLSKEIAILQKKKTEDEKVRLKKLDSNFQKQMGFEKKTSVKKKYRKTCSIKQKINISVSKISSQKSMKKSFQQILLANKKSFLNPNLSIRNSKALSIKEPLNFE